MPTLAQTLGAELTAKQVALETYFKEHPKDEMKMEHVEHINSANAELAELGKKWEMVRDVENIEAKNRELGIELAKPRRTLALGGPPDGDEQVKSLSFGEAICSVLYAPGGEKGAKREIVTGRDLEAKDFNPLEYKTTMTTAAGWAPQSIRSGRVELTPTVPTMLMTMLPTINVPNGVYTYMQETTYTNSADTILEAQAYPESALALTPQTANIYKVGTILPITEEQLSDVDGLRAYADGRIRTMVETKVENKLLNATGTNDINGFYNQVTQTYALAGDDLVFDAIFKGMNKVRTIGFASPDMVVIHPNDYVDIRLARTGDGIYIMGNPDVVGSDRLFGIRVLQTTNATEGTALVGDFGTHSALLVRWGLDVLATNSHSTHFANDIIDLKARERVGLAIFRILAFCEVTGI